MAPGGFPVPGGVAARYRREGHWPGVVLTDRLFEIARRDPDRELVVDPAFGRFTYAQIAAQVERLAFGLRELGVGPGDIAVVELPNWMPFAVFHLALTAIGAITVNVPPIYREREIGYIAGFTEAKLLVLPAAFRGYDFLPMAAALQRELSSLRHVFVVGEGSQRAGAGVIRYEEFMDRPWEAHGRPADLQALRPDPDAVTAIGFTSGTTGDLKGAPQTSNILFAINKGFIDRYGLLNPDDPRGIPHPTTYVLDRQGVVRWKFTEVNYKIRPTNAMILEALSGVK